MHSSFLHDHVFQELCGDGLLEALGVTTNGEWGVSDDAWEDFVNNVRNTHAFSNNAHILHRHAH
jgi:hypothetical protein